jgi:hypothetical protein
MGGQRRQVLVRWWVHRMQLLQQAARTHVGRQKLPDPNARHYSTAPEKEAYPALSDTE